jgi:hypothetical protein
VAGGRGARLCRAPYPRHACAVAVAPGPAAGTRRDCARPVRDAERSDLARAETLEGERGIERWRRRGARSVRDGQHRSQRGLCRNCRGPRKCGARMMCAIVVGRNFDARRAGRRRARPRRARRGGRGAVRRAAGHRRRCRRGGCAGRSEAFDAANRPGEREREQHCREFAHRAKSLPATRWCGNPGRGPRFALFSDGAGL